MGFLKFFTSSSRSTKLETILNNLEKNLIVLENSSGTNGSTSTLIVDQESIQKSLEKISKGISSIRKFLSAQSLQSQYTAENSNINLSVSSTFTKEFFHNGILVKLISNLERFGNESQKTVGYIFKNLLHRHDGPNNPTVDYICANPEILYTLMFGYEQPGLCIICGPLLLECAKFESLASLILYSKQFGKFFDLAECDYFEVASSAMTAIKDLLAKSEHSKLVTEFLEQYYDAVIQQFTSKLIVSENYYTKREGIKLLGEILLNKSNYNIRHRFISSSSNLKLLMRLLVNKSLAIQYEAFHVFKAFFSIPDDERTPEVRKILFDNKAKLTKFVENFRKDENRLEDEQLLEEKMFIIKQISQLQCTSNCTSKEKIKD